MTDQAAPRRPGPGVRLGRPRGMAWLTGRPGRARGPGGTARPSSRRSGPGPEELTVRLRRRWALRWPSIPWPCWRSGPAMTGLARGGDGSVAAGAPTSCACADGWVAVSLPEGDDWELVAAWLGLRADRWTRADGPRWPPAWPPWRAAELRARAELMGLPVGVLGERRRSRPGTAGPHPRRPRRAMRRHRRHPRPADPAGAPPSAPAPNWWWWTSRPCGPGRWSVDLLGRAGARVVKVESTTRPDGARCGSPRVLRVASTGARSRWPSTSPRPSGRRQLGRHRGRGPTW